MPATEKGRCIQIFALYNSKSRVTISPEKKIILQKEEEHCAFVLYSSAHTLCGVYSYG